MTNREKYAEQIIDMALNNENLAVKADGNVLCRCEDIKCEECIVNNCYGGCTEKIKKWFEQEYDEPAVDWSNVPVDTKIFVRNNSDSEWLRRHFAKFEDGRVYVWVDGRTSYTGNITDYWDVAKLAEEETK